MVKKIGGRYNNKQVSKLKIGDEIITEPTEIANILAKHQQAISSNNNYSPEFLETKAIVESNDLVIEYNPLNPLNFPFSYDEFNKAIKSRKDTSPGPDNMCISMVKNLTDDNKIIILKLLNKVYAAPKLPDAWTQSIGIPILKKRQAP